MIKLKCAVVGVASDRSTDHTVKKSILNISENSHFNQLHCKKKIKEKKRNNTAKKNNKINPLHPMVLPW